MSHPSAAFTLSPQTLSLETNQATSAITDNNWHDWRQFTQARIALGRAGAALPTAEILDFGLSHAAAQDAIHNPLNTAQLAMTLTELGITSYTVTSCVHDRSEYLRRPDLGRQHDPESWRHWDSISKQWQPLHFENDEFYDVALVAADGLSALAIERHFVPFLTEFFAQKHPAWRIAPVVIATQARVALGDAIGQHLNAKMLAVCIGERPGLSSPDSMGIYLTFDPKIGKNDAQRNCISNVRPQGLSYQVAAHKLVWLIQQGLDRQVTGVMLKDESDNFLVQVG